MIVIDDIWKIDHWKELSALHLKGTKSKILLTTRTQAVAIIGHQVIAGLLNEDDGWELLKKKAFPHSKVPDFPFEENLVEKVGKEMVGKCGKLPLAISLLGGILSKKKSRREWELVNENISAYLYRGDDGVENEIHGVLNLSYQELPYYLKSCFHYMGQFKEDAHIFGNELCLRWIALGMISHKNQQNEENLMDIAQRYLSELASIRGQTHRLCKLHDLVRELCLSVGKEEDFGLQILDYDGEKFTSLLHAKTRHLVANFKREIELEIKELTITGDEDTVKLVRSLHFFNYTGECITNFSQSIIDLKKFKLLKILVFEGFDFVGRKLPRGIGNLILLRNLCLIACKCDELPSSISNLVYLDTLDLSYSKNVRIPNNVLNKMILPDYNVEEMGSYILRLEGLDELETLTGFNSLVHQLKSLTGMKNLQHFKGVIHDNKSLSEVIHAVFTNRKHLRCGELEIKQDCHISSAEEDFKKLFAFPNIHNLGINVPIGKMLKELENHFYTSNLVFLYLVECEIEEDPMETLGKLPVLRDLILVGRCFVGEKMTCHASAFPCLRWLCIAELPNLREWRVEKGVMPLVSQIEIINCPCLEMLPDGFEFLATLTVLWIHKMPELGKRVSDEGGEDFDKVRHVPQISISD